MPLRRTSADLGAPREVHELQHKVRVQRRRYGCCVFAVTLMTVLVVMPLCIFALSVFLATLLWAVECYGHTDTDMEMDVCSFYDWFLYATGNLVGLSSPLTEVKPVTGLVAAELFDLVVASWSLALKGTVIGVIGGLTITNSSGRTQPGSSLS